MNTISRHTLIMFIVRLFAPYGTMPKQAEFQGIFTTKDKAMERVHFWKDMGCVEGYTALIETARVDNEGKHEKVFEVQL